MQALLGPQGCVEDAVSAQQRGSEPPAMKPDKRDRAVLDLERAFWLGEAAMLGFVMVAPERFATRSREQGRRRFRRAARMAREQGRPAARARDCVKRPELMTPGSDRADLQDTERR